MERVISVEDREWYVVIQTPDHSTDTLPLLLLHGFTGSGAVWQTVVGQLAQVRPCITVDITGHGRSSAPWDVSAYRMPVVARDVLSVMSELGWARFHLLGYSMGGRLALFIAQDAPNRVASLCLESASPGLDAEEERIRRQAADERLADAIEADGVPAFVARWEQLPLFETQSRLPADVLERQREIRLQQRSHGLANSLRGMGTGVQPSLWDSLSRLTMPVLLVTGALDAKFCDIADRMAQRIPDVRRQVVSNAGHTVHLERPDEYVEVVASFLSNTP
ncbi:putative 2-succinyl-6-hydroxy-2,4-cyclohexadiene-1-carboxylate synthase [Alicyclobacillus contaminans]|uniref:2-succinyl-6-hydroxy-2, 4-cyclohexadiene-1-carboxylate synthase n=1 Tax=Alicyclobacillus contaminans TaxID=392016 RepID=UPI000423FCC7|nr:2-succinyl-6-hydroxy-2,4-cyclohexadiene-1-carboxylate synthase [Alicyclobacillus contaminans]GMA52271.1 putative 2-succinyl-6-hydroxy-2,4-cyclohexadiene-1-carboxylate synthase [Alicyclobacillus contaminans]